VGETLHDDVHPGSELVRTAQPDLHAGWRDALVPGVEGTAEHILERDEPVASPGQQRADRRVGEVRHFDLRGSAEGGVGVLDLRQRRLARHAAEAEPGHLVER